MNLSKDIDLPHIRAVGRAADSLDLPTYIVGGYVRDLFLERHSKDIDFVAVGDGIALARAVASASGRNKKVNIFRTYGTAQIKSHGLELEFVGARKESYTPESRNPEVSQGTLDDDLSRRDFTINAMAVSVNASSFGELLDPFNGLVDLHNRVIRTPLDPDTTFSDDPLRMMRAVRFATQLDFVIEQETHSYRAQRIAHKHYNKRTHQYRIDEDYGFGQAFDRLAPASNDRIIAAYHAGARGIERS